MVSVSCSVILVILSIILPSTESVECEKSTVSLQIRWLMDGLCSTFTVRDGDTSVRDAGLSHH